MAVCSKPAPIRGIASRRTRRTGPSACPRIWHPNASRTQERWWRAGCRRLPEFGRAQVRWCARLPRSLLRGWPTARARRLNIRIRPNTPRPTRASPRNQPNASGIWHGIHSSVERRMGGAVGCSNPMSAVERANRLCCSWDSRSDRRVFSSAVASSRRSRVCCFSRRIRSVW